jgi:hypothetical protein
LVESPNATLEQKATVLRFAMLMPNNPIANLAEKLNCFNTDIAQNLLYNHKVTLCVDQPLAGTNAPATSKSLAGHTWLVLEQDQGNGQVIKLCVGFYPNKAVLPCSDPTGGAFNNDENRPFDVSVAFNVSGYAFSLLIENMKSGGTPDYQLGTTNCTTWAVGQLDAIGNTIPTTEQEILYLALLYQQGVN